MARQDGFFWSVRHILWWMVIWGLIRRMVTEIGRMLTRDQDNVDNVKGVGGHEEDVDSLTYRVGSGGTSS